jgi:hypothetical protein
MRKETFEWEFQKEERQQPKGVNVEPIIDWLLRASLCVLNAMSPCFLIISVPIAGVTKGEK